MKKKLNKTRIKADANVYNSNPLRLTYTHTAWLISLAIEFSVFDSLLSGF